MNLMDFAEKIETKEDFVQFLKLFYENFIHNENEFENSTLESFLSGMERFLSDSTEKSLIVVDFTPSWQMFAKLLITASIYE